MNSAKLILLGLLGTALAPATAHAQGYDDLDPSQTQQKKKRTPGQIGQDEVVREIVKGTYAKADVGGSMYLGKFAGFVSPGTALGLAFGQDFIDQEKSSMAWEVAFFQGINNGMHYELQAQQYDAGDGSVPFLQGDLRTYTFVASIEYSVYPNRRIGIGGRAGGGVLLSPLLMDPDFFQSVVVNGAWPPGAYTGYHDSPHPVVLGGPTFEYYTKLSHFSVGLDVDVFYAIQFDLGMNIAGAVKYTF